MTINQHRVAFGEHPHKPIHALRYTQLRAMGYCDDDEVPDQFWNLEVPIHNIKKYKEWMTEELERESNEILSQYYTLIHVDGLTYYEYLVASYARGGKDVNLYNIENQLKQMATTKATHLFNKENSVFNEI